MNPDQRHSLAAIAAQGALPCK